ncbi:MAG: hypothetical protein GXO44_01650 [Deferribacteres bacterium]|nr:hypothetical protein [Deferribacteres bacterium]
MRRLGAVFILFAVFAGCAVKPRTNPQNQAVIDKIPAMLEEGKRFHIDRDNPDLWESINLMAKEAKEECRKNSPQCKLLYENLRQLIIKGIQIEEKLKNP